MRHRNRLAADRFKIARVTDKIRGGQDMHRGIETTGVAIMIEDRDDLSDSLNGSDL